MTTFLCKIKNLYGAESVLTIQADSIESAENIARLELSQLKDYYIIGIVPA
jgi:hypothetical protein